PSHDVARFAPRWSGDCSRFFCPMFSSIAHASPNPRSMPPAARPEDAPSICFVGLRNLPVLAREYGRHGAGGAEVQQTLLARALAQRGLRVSMVVGDYGQSDGASWDGIKTYKASGFDEGIPLLRFVHPRWTKLWNALKRADADIYYTSCAGATVGQVA